MNKLILVSVLFLIFSFSGLLYAADSRFDFPTCNLERGGIAGNLVHLKLKNCNISKYDSVWVQLDPSSSELGINIVLIALDSDRKVKLKILKTDNKSYYRKTGFIYLESK